jgi:hypothetical protein
VSREILAAERDDGGCACVVFGSGAVDVGGAVGAAASSGLAVVGGTRRAGGSSGRLRGCALELSERRSHRTEIPAGRQGPGSC